MKFELYIKELAVGVGDTSSAKPIGWYALMPKLDCHFSRSLEITTANDFQKLSY